MDKSDKTNEYREVALEWTVAYYALLMLITIMATAAVWMAMKVLERARRLT